MLDSSINTPLYYQLYETLVEYINEELKENDKLPTEKEICIEYSVSRTTVRLALDELQRRGYIYRLQGKGSFVAEMKNKVNNSFISLDLRNHFHNINLNEIEYKISDISNKEANLQLQQKMGLKTNHLVKTFTIDYIIVNKKICSDIFIFKSECFNHLERNYIKGDEIDNILSKNGVEIKAIEEQYNIVKFDNNSKDNDALNIIKEYYDKNNEIVIILNRKIQINNFAYSNIFWID